MENKVWRFIKNNKKKLAAAIGVAIVGGVVYAMTRDKKVITAIQEKFPNDLPIPEISLGKDKVTNLWVEGNYVNAIIGGTTMPGLVKVMEELVEKVDEIEPDGTASAIIGFTRK